MSQVTDVQKNPLRSVMHALRGLNRMRNYVFAAFAVTLLTAFAVLLVRIEQTAFDRELIHVREGHLIIAENLAEALSRYAVDLMSTFDFLLAAYDDTPPPQEVVDLMADYDLHYFAIVDQTNTILQQIGSAKSEFPDAAALDVIRAEAATGGTVITGIIRINDQPLLFVTRALADGRLAIAPFDTNYLAQVQKAVAFGELGHSMLVDKNGLVIAHPNPEWQRTSKDASPLSVVQAMLAGETGVMQFYSPPLAADMIAGHTWVPETGWGVMVPQPIRELHASAQTHAAVLVRVLVVVMVLALIASWVLAGVIEGPLRRFSDTVQAIRNGNLRARVPRLPWLSPNETRDLRVLFNGLMDKLESDASLLRQSLDAAESANQARSRFVGVLSHEMRTPLNGIVATLELMRQTPLDADQQRYLSMIDTSSQTLKGHVDDVLELTRLESGQIKLDPTSFAVRDLVAEVVDVCRPMARANGNSISVSYGAGLPAQITADRRKLRQILENLTGNAAKFTRNGEISVSVGILKRGVLELTVTDTGPGIAEADQDRVFEPFATVDSSFARTAEGTGLGLSIVKSSVEAMGGEISLTSELGHGATFRVQTPVEYDDTAQPAAAQPAPAANTPDPVLLQQVSARLPCGATQCARLLVVEDNVINATVLREILERLGHNVTVAENGEDGLEVALAQEFDLILMDISMPGMDGTEVTRAIRTREGPNRLTPIVAQTAHARPEDRDRFHDAGMQRVLIKPISRKKLLALFEADEAANEAPPAEPAPLALPLLEREAFTDLCETVGRDRAMQLFDSSVEELDAVIAAIQTSEPDHSAASDAMPPSVEGVRKCAGTYAAFGASRLHGLLKELETALRGGVSPEALSQTILMIRNSTQETRRVLDEAA